MKQYASPSKKQQEKADLTFLILTFNEEVNLPYLLDNICDLGAEIFILDSYSTDRTVEIASSFGAKIFYRKFDNFSNQRNFALEQLPITTPWVFFIDADELLSSELKIEILKELRGSTVDAYYINRRFYWKDKWIKRGYYPISLLRLGRLGKIKCDDSPVNEHLICTSGKVKSLRNDFMDYNRKDLNAWISKHNEYSNEEAKRLFTDRKLKGANVFGNQYQRKRWIRRTIWTRLPPLIRPVFYFLYRYVVRGGFLDGKEAFMYHFLHAFIYRMLIDFKYLELKWNRNQLKIKTLDQDKK